MEEKKIVNNEDLEKVVGGTDTNTSAGTPVTTENPFAALPRVQNNVYTPDIINRS